MIALLLAPVAQAFCGAFVGGPGQELTNGASQLVVARQGTHTTLTMVNDYQGDLASFGLLVPVPPGLTEDEVRVVDRSLVRVIDNYSGPRLVAYTCEDFGGWAAPEPRNGPAMATPLLLLGGCSSPDLSSSEGPGVRTPEEAESSVTVESQFAEGEYSFSVLSAEEGEGLAAWLDAHGYAISEDMAELLDVYIASGSHFLAAQVELGAVPAGAASLNPIQLSYWSEAWTLPIRLGTANSAGEQDLLLYVINDYAQGAAGIANYPAVSVESECLFREEEADSFGAFYGERFDEAMADQGAAWTLEYAWGITPTSPHCDPCAPPPPELEGEDPLPDAVIEELGFLGADSASDSGFASSGSNFFVSRIHVRYRADAVPEDLSLYASGFPANSQLRYIRHAQELEGSFPVCGEGWVDSASAGTCGYGLKPHPAWGLAPVMCATGQGRGFLGLVSLVGLAAILARRRPSPAEAGPRGSV